MDYMKRRLSALETAKKESETDYVIVTFTDGSAKRMWLIELLACFTVQASNNHPISFAPCGEIRGTCLLSATEQMLDYTKCQRETATLPKVEIAQQPPLLVQVGSA